MNVPRFNTEDGTTGYNDLFAKRETVDERMQFAVNLGNILIRTLDQMMKHPEARESAFELGSGETAFEIIVRKKA